jgi:hypothetical protein
MTYNFKKGNHYSNPRLRLRDLFAFNKTQFSARFRFHSGYLSEQPDQWNKLCGISWSFKPNKDSVMIAYRWNSIKKKMEITPYVNQNFEFNTGEIFECDLNQYYFINVKIENGKFFVELKVYEKGFDISTFKFKEMDSPQPKWFGTFRQPYHGGRGLPLSDYSLEMKYL